MEALGEDELLLVFDFLDIADRLRLEAVSSLWRRILRRSWRPIRRLQLHNLLYRSHLCIGPTGCLNLEIRDAVFEAILRRCPALESLSLGPSASCGLEHDASVPLAAFGLTHELLNAIAAHAPALRRLSLAGHVFPSVNFLRKLLRSLHLPQMEHLCLDFGRIDADSPVEAEEGVRLLRRGLEDMPALKSFSMRGRGSCFGHMVLDEGFFSCVPPGLSSLSISAGLSLHITRLFFVKRLPQLTHLDVEKSGIRSLEPLPTACPQLSSLNIAFCRSLSDFSPLGRLPNLRRLRVDGNREHFDNAALESVCTACPDMTELSLDACARLSSVGFQHEGLKAVSRLSALRRLSLGGLLGLEDGGLAEICLGCPRLRRLQLKGCRKLGRRALLGLAALAELEELGVALVPDYDAALHAELRVACPRLRYVQALDCAIRLKDRSPGCVLVASI